MERTRASSRLFERALVGARRSSGRAPLELTASRQLSGYTNLRAANLHALRKPLLPLRNEGSDAGATHAQPMSGSAAPSACWADKLRPRMLEATRMQLP